MGTARPDRAHDKLSAPEADALYQLSYGRILRKHDCSGKDKQARSGSPGESTIPSEETPRAGNPQREGAMSARPHGKSCLVNFAKFSSSRAIGSGRARVRYASNPRAQHLPACGVPLRIGNK